MKQDEKGFSLLELLVTLGIISIVAAIGAPSFQGAIRSSRLTTSINEFSNAFSLARSEAIKQNRHVVVRKTGTNWENGWQIFVDIDRDGTATKDNVFNDNGDTTLCEATEDCLLKIHEALPNGYTLRPSATGLANYVRYTPSGISNGVSGSFYLCDTNTSSTPQTGTSKVLVLNTVGRPRVAVDSDNNGIPEVTRGTDITTCTP